MTQSRCLCGHDEFMHVRMNGRIVCSGDYGECGCTKFQWDNPTEEIADAQA